MTQSHKTLVVMPAFNEQESISGVIGEIQKSFPEFQILVVDDGSTDRTASIAKEAGALVASLPFNLGVGGAMRFGYKYGLAKEFSAVVQIDSDGQHDPKYIPQLLEGLSHSDLIIGARFAGLESYQIGFMRRLTMKFLSVLLSRVAKSHLTDTTSGFKAAGPRAIRLFSENFPVEYLGDTVEALVIASKAGLRISQCPVAMRERTGGAPSHSPFKSALFLARAVLAFTFAIFKPVDKEAVAS